MERHDERIVAATQSTLGNGILCRDVDRRGEWRVGRPQWQPDSCGPTVDGDPDWRCADLQCWSFSPFYSLAGGVRALASGIHVGRNLAVAPRTLTAHDWQALVAFLESLTGCVRVGL